MEQRGQKIIHFFKIGYIGDDDDIIIILNTFGIYLPLNVHAYFFGHGNELVTQQ